jgi:RNA polymerase sigma-70 factor (ECF subfamily)
MLAFAPLFAFAPLLPRLSGRPGERKLESPAMLPADQLRAGDAALVARLRAGDDHAYAELVRTLGPRLLAVCRRLLRDEDDARDALQDAFVQAFRALGGFHGEALLSTWLHRIAVNSCLMRLRRRRSRPEESLEPLLPRFLDDGHQVRPSAAWEDSPDRRVEQGELRRLVRAAIDRLPETYRTVLLLRDLEELDTATVAQLLGVTENAVKIRLHRARQALRGLLDPALRSPS